MKPSEHGNGDDAGKVGSRFERLRDRHALADPLVRTRGVEIPKAVLAEHSLEVALAQDDHVIEAFAAHAAKESFARRVHERGSHGGAEHADAGALRGAVEVGTELTIVIADDELGPEAEGCGFPELLCRPLRGRVPRDADVHDALGVDVHDEEREDWPKPNVVYLEKIAGPHGMIAQERVPVLPARRRRIPMITHVPLHGALRDVDSELDKLATNALGAPKPILSGHALNEFDDIGRDARSRRLLRPRLPAPEQAKPFPVPAKHGLGLHEQQRVAPSWKRRYKERDQSAFVAAKNRSLHLPCRHNELLAQKDVLGQQLGPGAQHVSREATDDRARPWTQRFADSLRNAREDRLQFSEDTSGHETDLRRDELHFKPLLLVKSSTILLRSVSMRCSVA